MMTSSPPAQSSYENKMGPEASTSCPGKPNPYSGLPHLVGSGPVPSWPCPLQLSVLFDWAHEPPCMVCLLHASHASAFTPPRTAVPSAWKTPVPVPTWLPPSPPLCLCSDVTSPGGLSRPLYSHHTSLRCQPIYSAVLTFSQRVCFCSLILCVACSLSPHQYVSASWASFG